VSVSAAIEERQLHLIIADTGIGMHETDLKRIFVEFSQVDASHTRRYEGTGLGLALSKRLVEAHGGRIWVKAPSMSAASFMYCCPCGQVKTVIRKRRYPHKGISIMDSLRDDMEQCPDPGNTILVVEDNPRQRSCCPCIS